MGAVEMPEAAKLPLIRLDTTLADLYKRGTTKNATREIVQVLCGISSGVDLGTHMPRNVKFIYQDSPFNSVPTKKLNSQNGKLQRSLAIKYLSLIPQRDAMICGKTKVVIFETDSYRNGRQEVERTMSGLHPSQHPELVFCPGPEHIPGMDDQVIAYKLALDGLETYALTVELEKHWFLNTKGALAESGLPTPPASIIDIVGYASLPHTTCCIECRTGDGTYIFEACSGPRGRWILDQTQRIIQAIEQHSVPFVLKNQQSFGGAGTYVINTEEEKRDLLTSLVQDETLRKILSRVTQENYHLKPASIVLSSMVEDAIGDYGLTFFATENGEPIFMAVSEQMIDDSSAWIGSAINYDKQGELEKKFGPIMNQIAAWLHGHDYFGPVGADILETKGENTEDQTLHIVDLNVRTSGSLCLPLLRGHFTSRGLSCASSFSITFNGSRGDFIQQWRKQLEAGRMCILSWYEDTETGQSMADVVVGGEDETTLHECINEVRASSEQVTF